LPPPLSLSKTPILLTSSIRGTKDMYRLFLAMAASLIMSGAAMAKTNLIDATDPSKILAIAKGFGLADLGKDKQGDTRISGRMDGVRYGILFYGCQRAINCKSIQFYAGFEMREKPSAEKMNEFNRKYRFVRTYLDDDGDPAIELDVNLI